MKKLQVIDLFSGAGGLSYGFESAGCEIKLAIEKDLWAVDTYKLNHINKNIREEDITTLPDEYFYEYINNIDIVMGGPPCQGFSIAASNRRKENDSRNTLYQHFLRVVSIVKPKLVLIENVKEIAGYKLPDGRKILDDIKNFFTSNNYIFDYSILNCRKYGIPQDRKRFFFIAVKSELLDSSFKIEELMKRFETDEISFLDAVSDLPEVRPKEHPENAVLSYVKSPQNDYQKKLRGNCIQLNNHIPMQHTDKTIEKFKLLLSGHKGALPDNLKPRVHRQYIKVDEPSKPLFSMLSELENVIFQNSIFMVDISYF